KCDSAQLAVNVARIIEQRATQRCSDERQPQWKSELLVELQYRLPADRKSRRIARPGLVERESPKRRAATSEKPFGQRNQSHLGCLRRERQRLGIAIRRQNSDPQRARKAEFSADGMVGRVLKEKSQKACAGTDIRVRDTKIRAVET